MTDPIRSRTSAATLETGLRSAAALAFAGVLLGTLHSVSARGFRTHARLARFTMLDPALTTAQAPHAPPHRDSVQAVAHNGSTIAAHEHGALFIDGDSGQLLFIDRRSRVRARTNIGHDAAQLVYHDPSRLVMVSDRRGDRVAVLRVERGFEHVRDIATRAEPYGLALSPGGETLLVTTIADRQLTAYDVHTGRERWSVDLAQEPRAVALSPAGDRALVTFATQSAVARIQLAMADNSSRDSDRDSGSSAPPARVRYTSLARYQGASSPLAAVVTDEPLRPDSPPTPDAGRTHSRAAYAAAYLGDRVVAIPYQKSTPAQHIQRVDVGTYGGSRLHVPIKHMLAFVADRDTTRAHTGQVAHAELSAGHARALLYDRRRDTLFLASYNTDRILALSDASRPSIRLAWQVPIVARTNRAFAGVCGPSGLALAADGALFVHCQLARTVALVESDKLTDGSMLRSTARIKAGTPMAKSRLSPAAQRGRILFTQMDNRAISADGALACMDCHPEGRTDGLSWAIDGGRLQTPVLAGRMVGTLPFKWNGHDLTLGISINNTIRRLGGHGLDNRQNDDLVAFLESLPPPRTPTPADVKAVARGRLAFVEAGCEDCHKGPALADSHLHELDTNLATVNTPSLIGVSMSAPYFHDGSAASLRAVLLDNGTVHDMADVSDMTRQQLDDLIAYLSTL